MEFMVSTSEADKLFKKSRAEKQLYDRMLKCGAETRTQRSEENGKRIEPISYDNPDSGDPCRGNKDRKHNGRTREQNRL